MKPQSPIQLPARQASIPSSLVASLLLVLSIHSGALLAQSDTPPLPVLTLHDAQVFEGNSGTTNLVFVVELDRPATTAVTGLFSNVSLSAVPTVPGITGPATGGLAPPTFGVDYIRQSNLPFTIPIGATMTTVTMTVVGDATVELDEVFGASVLNVFGARFLSGSNTAIGTILNDDGPPRISIADVSVSEPFGKTKTRVVNFTVSLSHPKPGNGSITGTSVNFATVAGSATGATGGSIILSPDYVPRTGTLNIPQGATSGQIGITILGDDLVEPDETFQLILSNATGGTIADGSATGTIRNFTLTTGAFDFAPDKAWVRVDEIKTYTVVWTVPEGEVWRDLKTIDFRLHNGHESALWVRWDEASNTFSLGRQAGQDHKGRNSHHDPCDDDGVSFGPGEAPGSNALLETPLARLHLAGTSVTGSGADGLTVTLQLAISFRRKAANHALRVEVAASDDRGHTDDFTRAGTVFVKRGRRH